ncbi:MAG: hypothetical protein P8Z49_01475 [Acidobacteriota bacterium]|jgi:hypothetical protein
MTGWIRRLCFAAGAAAMVLIPAASTAAFSPEWARPYLKRPTPSGAYITKKDHWVAVYKSIIFSTTPHGGMAATYRMVLAPTGREPRRLLIAMDYDSETQTLENPQVWEPGVFGYKRINLAKTSLDFPDLSSDALTSGRFRFISTKAIAPDKRAIVTWKVTDRFAFPGEMLAWPFGMYPAEKLVIRGVAAGGGAVHITYVTPGGKGGAAMKTGPVHLENLPALRYVYKWGNPWLPSRFQAIPFILAVPEKAAGRTWADVSSAVDRIFVEAGKDGAASVKRKADSLISADMGEKARIDVLVRFVAGLAYRNVQWGRGAYTPASPSETLRSMTADCKAKALLLMKLLEAVGVHSNLVLCRVDDHYLADFPLPASAAFNHVVLAVKCKGGETLPASLTTGPGKGWVLVDPTDPQAVFGRQPMGLEGACALWVAPSDGAYFHVHTRQPALMSMDIRETVTVRESGDAGFSLRLHGSADLLEQLVSSKAFNNKDNALRRDCEEYLQSAAPGLRVERAAYRAAPLSGGRPSELTLVGEIPQAMQGVGGQLYTMLAPVAILGRILGIARLGYEWRGGADKPGPAVTVPCVLKPDYQAIGVERSALLTLVFPKGWSVKGTPSLNAGLSSPWLTVKVSGGGSWSVKISEPRGAFHGGSDKKRLEDMNRLASLFRQPILVQRAGGSKDPAHAKEREKRD